MDYADAHAKYGHLVGVDKTHRQRRKFARGEGIVYRLMQRYEPLWEERVRRYDEVANLNVQINRRNAKIQERIDLLRKDAEGDYEDEIASLEESVELCHVLPKILDRDEVKAWIDSTSNI